MRHNPHSMLSWFVATLILAAAVVVCGTPPPTTHTPKRIQQRVSPDLRRLRNPRPPKLPVVLALPVAKLIDHDALIEAEIRLNLAKMAFNEAWGALNDVIGIWQVTRALSTPEPRSRLGAQQRLSQRVTGVTEPRSPVHRENWTRNLTRSDKEPEGWPQDRLGSWEGQYSREWLATLDRADRVFEGRTRQRVCNRRVMAWGCNQDMHPRCGDWRIAEARGIVRDTSCRGALWYYYRPSAR